MLVNSKFGRPRIILSALCRLSKLWSLIDASTAHTVWGFSSAVGLNENPETTSWNIVRFLKSFSTTVAFKELCCASQTCVEKITVYCNSVPYLSKIGIEILPF